ncbi:MAG: sulfatase-like hydrolase/transferase, partial [Aeoliella sp.]
MIYADDMGYGDLSGFGATDLETPHIDSLATTGAKFTNFYNSSSACSTSRASLLTGSYHSRTSIHTVFSPGSNKGLNPNEITTAEMLNDAGYQSAMVGKWHLGHTTNMMPWEQGFDRFYGIPVSHDYNSGGPNYPGGVPTYVKEPGGNYRVERVINEFDSDEVAQYTQRFSEKAATYIKERDVTKPLFLYVAQPMPHVTLAVTEPFDGASSRGLYGDVMEELDAGVGTILQALEDEGIRDNTLVVFAADNGPWLSYGNHAGDSGGLREGKRTTFDG